MKVCVIGAGAAGLMCAITAAREGADVFILEKNEKIGKKIYITGKGRCNVTNCTDFDGYQSNIISGGKFLYSALKGFDSNQCMAFFEEIGLPLKVERGERVFPQSDKSSDVIKVLKKELERLNVPVYLQENVKDLIISNGIITHVVTDKKTYEADAFVVCTGGISYPATGSTGDGYIWAKKAGHTIIQPVPALCGIVLSGALDIFNNEIPLPSLPKIRGISLKNVNATVLDRRSGKKLYDEFGEMLFTERGISGPIVLTLSSKINRLTPDQILISLDLKPALTEKQLDERILRDFSTQQNKIFKNSLNALLPSGLIPLVVALSRINETKPVHSITKEERKKLVDVLKNMRFCVKGLEDISTAVVTSGGVAVSEINPKTMESKRITNLYFAGEVLDIDALTGGFNLQLAFATGYAAGKNLMKKGEKS